MPPTNTYWWQCNSTWSTYCNAHYLHKSITSCRSTTDNEYCHDPYRHISVTDHLLVVHLLIVFSEYWYAPYLLHISIILCHPSTESEYCNPLPTHKIDVDIVIKILNIIYEMSKYNYITFIIFTIIFKTMIYVYNITVAESRILQFGLHGWQWWHVPASCNEKYIPQLL